MGRAFPLGENAYGSRNAAGTLLGYLTKCQELCKIKFLTLVSTGFKPGLVTVNLDFWYLTCSSPPAASGDALRKNASARSVSAFAFVPENCFSHSGTAVRIFRSLVLRAFPDLTYIPMLAVFRRTVRAGDVILRAFITTMVGSRSAVCASARPPVFLFS